MDDRLIKYLSLYRATKPQQIAALEGEVWEAYGVDRAVIALDMSGFSRITERHGILHFLSLIQHMREVTRPIVETGGGEVVKYEADNMFAVTATADDALAVATAIVAAFARGNRSSDEASRIHVSIGIDYGRLLLIPGVELFGGPVNFACKLGEDVAGRDEILMTKVAYARLTTSNVKAAGPIRHDISGVALEAYSIRP